MAWLVTEWTEDMVCEAGRPVRVQARRSWPRSPKNRTGLAAVAADGRLLASGSALTDDEIVAWIIAELKETGWQVEVQETTYRGQVVRNITGKRIRLRIRLETLYNNSTPKIDAIVVEGLVTVPSKQKIEMTFRLEDNGKDLLGSNDDYYDADTKLAQLRSWAASAGTIAMSGHLDEINNLRVKLDYPSLQIIKHEVDEVGTEKRNVYIAQIGAWVLN